MRQPRDPQLNLYHIMPRNKVAQELIAISSVLDENRDMLDLIYQDIMGLRKADTGRTWSERRTGSAVCYPETISAPDL